MRLLRRRRGLKRRLEHRRENEARRSDTSARYILLAEHYVRIAVDRPIGTDTFLDVNLWSAHGDWCYARSPLLKVGDECSG